MKFNSCLLAILPDRDTSDQLLQQPAGKLAVSGTESIGQKAVANSGLGASPFGRQTSATECAVASGARRSCGGPKLSVAPAAAKKPSARRSSIALMAAIWSPLLRAKVTVPGEKSLNPHQSQHPSRFRPLSMV